MANHLRKPVRSRSAAGRMVAAVCAAGAVLMIWAAIAAAIAAEGSAPGGAAAADAADAAARGHDDMVAVVQRHCLRCHSGDRVEGDVDLSGCETVAAMRSSLPVWQRAAEMTSTGQMPPPDEPQPTAEERAVVSGWLGELFAAEGRARAGDPGRVVLRRLNNAEYTYTLRDLTGLAALEPAREFPADAGAGEGFTNTGQTLVMSPTLFTKYLDAARDVAAHAVFLPAGLRFSAGSSRRDFADEAVAAIQAFYRRFAGRSPKPLTTVLQGVTLDLGNEGFLAVESAMAAVLEARATAKPTADVARERGVNARYLATLERVLATPVVVNGSPLLDGLRGGIAAAGPADAPRLAAEIEAWQGMLWKFNQAGAIARHLGRPDGPTSWLEPVSAVVEKREIRLALAVPAGATEVTLRLAAGGPAGAAGAGTVWGRPRLVAKGREDVLLRTLDGRVAGPGAESAGPARFGGEAAGGDAGADDLHLPSGETATFVVPADVAAQAEFVSVVAVDPAAAPETWAQPTASLGAPPTATVLPPPVPFVARPQTAAWERLDRDCDEFRRLFPRALCYARIVPVDEVITLNVYYREDEHLRRLMLDDTETAELERLWDELLFVSQEPLELLDGYEQILGYVSQDPKHESNGTFAAMRPTIEARARDFRERLVAVEPRQVDAVVEFAARAYRRPLTAAEGDDLRGLYARLRREGLPHDAALRLVLTRILVSPPFLYKLETPGPGVAAAPVPGLELATRLSYFLWSSVPDAELEEAGRSGRLTDTDVLLTQTRRMLRDERIRRLAAEFGTQWLHVYGFAAHDEKNAEAFPTFAGLRGAMEEETILFLADLFRRDLPVTGLLDADHTFLNEPLARHYGIPGVSGPEWRRVEGVQRHGRGGVLFMASVLSAQSGASRTSPILRGNWLCETMLGERLPKPPKNVPLLAETVPQGLTERQLVALHSSAAACAVCHRRIDPLGFSLEGFDGIGRRREVDAAGQPIDARARLEDGTALDGHEGLREWLMGPRRRAFVRQFCRKLLGYALGRGVQLSDEPLLDEIEARLAADGDRVWLVVEAIVTSRQFRDIRGMEAADEP